jgi:hypothetical protein
MNGWHKGLLSRLRKLDGIEANQSLLEKLLRESIETADLTPSEWSALATLRHVIRPSLGGPEDPGAGVTDEEFAALQALEDAEKKTRS